MGTKHDPLRVFLDDRSGMRATVAGSLDDTPGNRALLEQELFEKETSSPMTITLSKTTVTQSGLLLWIVLVEKYWSTKMIYYGKGELSDRLEALHGKEYPHKHSVFDQY